MTDKLYEVLTINLVSLGTAAFITGIQIVLVGWAILAICKKLGVGITFKIMLPWRRR